MSAQTNERLQTSSRHTEVEALRSFAEQTHPRGREAAENRNWQLRWESLAQDAETLSDGAYFVQLLRALAWFEDGHTLLLPFELVGGVPETLESGSFGLSFPFRVSVFHDGVFVTATSKDASPLLGARIEQFGNLTAQEIVAELSREWPGNDAWAHRWAMMAFSSPAFLEGIGAVENPELPIRIRAFNVEDEEIVVEVAPVRQRSSEFSSLPHEFTEQEKWSQEYGRGNYARVLPDRNALYVSIDEMGESGEQSFEDFTHETQAAIESSSVDRLIVDLRRNGGGDNFHGEAFRKMIGRSRFNQPGRIYVLIGPRTFSAAQNLATRLERETFALFVGEPTGGAPNHFGDAQSFIGETTGIFAMVSTLPWFDSYPQDERPWILPDLPVPFCFADWRDGHDSALRVALESSADVEVDEFDRVHYYARESQTVDWMPFWRR